MTLSPTIPVDIPAQRSQDGQRDGDGLETWPLVERAKLGDLDAFAELFRRYRELVYRAVYVRVGRDPHLAEDITATTFMRAWRSIGRVEYQGRDFAAFLMVIARNLIADHYKSGAVRLGSCLGLESPGDEGAPVAGEPMWAWAAPDPARTAERAELRRAVERALGELTAVQARIIRHRFLDGLSTEETAALEGMTIGAVKACQLRAVRALRQSRALAGHR